MKKLLALFLVLFAASSFGAVYQNYYVTNANPITPPIGANAGYGTNTSFINQIRIYRADGSMVISNSASDYWIGNSETNKLFHVGALPGIGPTRDLILSGQDISVSPGIDGTVNWMFTGDGYIRNANTVEDIIDINRNFFPLTAYVDNWVSVNDFTNRALTTKILGTDANGKMKGAVLSGLTWNGTTLTASGGDTLWGTNATSGKVTNILGGVSVGASSLNVSNGTASFINLLNSPATPRIMVGGNQTSFVTVNTNSIAGTNGSGFFVLDASGNQTNGGGFFVQTNSTATTSGGIISASAFAWQFQAAAGANLRLKASDATHSVIVQGSAGGSDLVVGNGGWATTGTNYTTGLSVVGQLISTNSVIATNGLFLPQLSAIPTSVDLRSSSGNTNWLSFNLGGEPIYLKTNAAAASSYITNYPTGKAVDAESGGLTFTTATPANVASISLTPGVWRISGSTVYILNPSIATFWGRSSIGTTSATLVIDGKTAYSVNNGVNTINISQAITPFTVTVTTDTTYYLVGEANFTGGGGSVTGTGYLSADRIR